LSNQPPAAAGGGRWLSAERERSLQQRLVARDERALVELVDVATPWLLGVALGMLQNRALLSAAQEVHLRLKQGQELSTLLDSAALFPKAAVQLVRVGEETGRLQEMLIEAADTLDREAQNTIKRLLSILVPSVTIVMGALVAVLIASVLVGILSLNDLAF